MHPARHYNEPLSCHILQCICYYHASVLSQCGLYGTIPASLLTNSSLDLLYVRLSELNYCSVRVVPLLGEHTNTPSTSTQSCLAHNNTITSSARDRCRDLDHNKLSGTIPASIESAKSLTQLYARLSHQFFSSNKLPAGVS